MLADPFHSTYQRDGSLLKLHSEIFLPVSAIGRVEQYALLRSPSTERKTPINLSKFPPPPNFFFFFFSRKEQDIVYIFVILGNGGRFLARAKNDEACTGRKEEGDSHRDNAILSRVVRSATPASFSRRYFVILEKKSEKSKFVFPYIF